MLTTLSYDVPEGLHIQNEQERTKYRTLGDALGQKSVGRGAFVDVESKERRRSLVALKRAFQVLCWWRKPDWKALNSSLERESALSCEARARSSSFDTNDEI